MKPGYRAEISATSSTGTGGTAARSSGAAATTATRVEPSDSSRASGADGRTVSGVSSGGGVRSVTVAGPSPRRPASRPATYPPLPDVVGPRNRDRTVTVMVTEGSDTVRTETKEPGRNA